MIASLRGTVSATSSNSVVLDVAGVGYLVGLTPATALSLSVGDELLLQTALIVREDAFLLFGFETPRELELFDLLRSVTGVGPKSALSIIGSLGVVEIQNAVASEDDAAFKAVSGIGPKTAKLITVTLAGKLKGEAVPVDAELLAALTGLGYSEVSAKAALRKAGDGTLQERLRRALAELASGRSGEKA